MSSAQPSAVARPSGRSSDQMRPVSFEIGVNKYAEGSCLVKFGDTHVLCLATVEEKVPGWLKGSGKGWVTAEYGMLPRATNERTAREAAKGQQGGRTQEIQRLVGRSLRAVTNLTLIPDLQIRVDCDVIQADGGTRTASISGGFVALHMAFTKVMALGLIKQMPLMTHVAAISCGIYKGTTVLDLDYAEDSSAETDANFVINGDGMLIEVQATAEGAPFSEAELGEMLRLARKGTGELVAKQKAVLGL
jgi:ribonuclease PH